jgi:AraC family transcriptional regulator
MLNENLYTQRLNLVINYIRENLSGNLSLETLAQVAGFSPFHFHRIFKTLTGETLNDFVSRVRLERAVALLKASPQTSITSAALACGFSSVSRFSQAFKAHYGFTARQWDRKSVLKNSKNRQVLVDFPHYTLAELNTIAANHEFTVYIRPLPPTYLAYIRVSDSYKPLKVVSAYERLLNWYSAKGGNLAHTTLFGMSQDDPDVTPLALCRYDFCLSVPEHWQSEGEISTRRFPACQIAYIRCKGDIFKVDRAWQYLFNYWLPRSHYQPDNLPALEIYRRQPFELGWEIYDLDCAIPITTL